MAAGLLRHRLDQLDVDIDVGSAGFTLHGKPVDRKAVAAMERRGIDISEHRSQLVSPALIDAALIVVVMVQRHGRDIVECRPAAMCKTFTLKELVRRGRDAGPQRDNEDADEWIDRVHSGRPIDTFVGSAPEMDIDDPLGRSWRTFESTADEIDSHLAELVGLWWPELASHPVHG